MVSMLKQDWNKNSHYYILEVLLWQRMHMLSSLVSSSVHVAPKTKIMLLVNCIDGFLHFREPVYL